MAIDRKKIKIVLRLFFLVGLPILVAFSMFSCGVNCGVNNRTGVLSFERDVLGMDVPDFEDEDDDKDKDDDDDDDEDKDDGDKDGKDKDGKDKDGEDKDGEDKDDKDTPPPVPQIVAVPTPVMTPTPVPPPAAVPSEPAAAIPPPMVATPDAVPADLKTAFETPVTARVKVLVDKQLVEARPDWVDYVQQIISHTSAVYEAFFGIEVKLHGVVVWDVAAEGLSANELITDVRGRQREGADIVLALTNRKWDAGVAGKGDYAAPDQPVNGAHALAYAHNKYSDPHLRQVLHELGHLFGADDVTDPESDGWRRGSFMSYAGVPDGSAAWIDDENRRRVLEGKLRPFMADSDNVTFEGADDGR